MTVSRVGTATGTTSATVPTHNVGDIIIIAAFRTNTTAPSLPAGYTSILTKSGTSSSMRVGYKVATATNDASGTWTNATALVCHVYRSSNYATGGSLYIGGSASNSSTTNTVNYPALTMIHGDNTSWALGFAGVSNLTETISTAPSGMTNQSLETATATQCAGHDTNGTVSSWSSTNATTTGAAGNSVSATVELIENQPGTAINNFVQHLSFSYNSTLAAGETSDNFVYSFDPSLAGNAFVVGVAYPNGVTPSITDNKSNTWPASGAAGTVTADAGAGNMVLQVFVLASAATGTSQITVSFGGNPVAPVKTWITQLYNVTATINTSAHAAAVNSGGIVSPGSITPGTNNCLILSYMADSNTSGNAATAPALIVPETGYNLNDADISFVTGGTPNASQFLLQGTAAATVPRFYLNNSAEAFNVVTVALTTGSQGTPKPSGPGIAPWIDRICHMGAAQTGSPTSWLLQIPSTGNCGLFTSFLTSNGSPFWSAVTDSDGTSWTFKNPVVGAASGFINTNQTPKSCRTAKVTISAVNQNLQVIYYDISNCAVSPVVANVAVTPTGANNSSSAADQPDITPTAVNQLTIAYLANGLGPTPSITTPSNAIYDLPAASIWKGTASITTTSMTVTATSWGALSSGPGPVISGTSVAAGTTISAGSASPWTIQPSQTVGSETMTGSTTDSDTMNWGTGAGHFFNNGSTAQQAWTWGIANQSGNTVTGFAIILKGPPPFTQFRVEPQYQSPILRSDELSRPVSVVSSAVVAPPSWVPTTGEEDRPANPNRIPAPDQPFPWFVRSPVPVPMVWWGTLEDSHPPPIKRPPDEPFVWFVRSPSPVPARWLPITGEEDRPPAQKRPPDEPSGYFFQKPGVVAPPTILWWQTLEDAHLPPIKRPPDEPFIWFVRSASPVPITWLPITGEEDRPPPQKRPPDEPSGYFLQRPGVVATSTILWWQTPEDAHLLPRPPQDDAKLFFRPATPAIWFQNGYDQPVYSQRADLPQIGFVPRVLGPGVAISGIAWWRQLEVYVGPPSPQLDFYISWNPQVVVQIAPSITVLPQHPTPLGAMGNFGFGWP